ncbi:MULTISPECIES: spore germination protein [unclassified Paenibacillus]|uniref:spore germination protein n=1 Tax=unclassified Paenibacillus TaxID=185978 RepID=UPI002404F8DF|nr:MULTISPECIES: spore germination protein [unclassified Paenibacillus]MDF9839047.1 spore germination protein [Paenibacillus sp. PastF-2]MDF9845629.1 spore germination protein [Paenibacillus sp. PastM-2]MDF9852201.1 spore germination protein [Paenibacillus sp. PastF-1]MDH6478070.1 spore germination protein [Paenibacillus sp. PastH-2]MDH6505804.1 spore germination protein [Paenibacillus sp. PastM-3]
MNILHRVKKALQRNSLSGMNKGVSHGKLQSTLNHAGTSKFAKPLDWLQDQLSNRTDLVIHGFTPGPGISCSLVFLNGMIDQPTVEKQVLSPIMSMAASADHEIFANRIFVQKQLPALEQQIRESLQDVLKDILSGKVVFLLDGEARMISIQAIHLEKRAVQEAPNESTVRGPREAFIEDLATNLTLLRRKLKTPALKIESMSIGTISQTNVAIVFLEGICSPGLVSEMKRRLSAVKLDAVLGSSYLEELIEDNPYSPFPQLQYTERPDVMCAAVLEGRIGLIVDGTPIALMAPINITMLMQASEDYYQRYVSASWIRLIRYLFAFISLLLPSVYVAITTFHPDMIPENLLITVASAREIVPFPALVEAMIMELSFEALREATVRIPKAIGQSVSIIGALIIGTAAVQAGIVSASMVIIVSMTGIASFIIPHFDLGLAFRLLRFPIMILGGVFGMFGIACGMLLLYLHLTELQSFGYPYMAPFAPLEIDGLKDTVIRAPWWKMRMRPLYAQGNRTRERQDARGWDNGDGNEE